MQCRAARAGSSLQTITMRTRGQSSVVLALSLRSQLTPAIEFSSHGPPSQSASVSAPPKSSGARIGLGRTAEYAAASPEIKPNQMKPIIGTCGAHSAGRTLVIVVENQAASTPGRRNSRLKEIFASRKMANASRGCFGRADPGREKGSRSDGSSRSQPATIGAVAASSRAIYKTSAKRRSIDAGLRTAFNITDPARKMRSFHLVPEK
jgi:hypothetical protein